MQLYSPLLESAQLASGGCQQEEDQARLSPQRFQINETKTNQWEQANNIPQARRLCLCADLFFNNSHYTCLRVLDS